MNWSIMAGWFADQGATEFLRRAIWRDAAMDAQLRLLPVAAALAELDCRLRGS